MVSSKGYVPVLLTKRGERGALIDLSATARSALTPLFVVEPIPVDFETKVPEKSTVEMLAGKPKELAESWGSRAAFIDLPFTDDALMPGDLHPVIWFVKAADSLGMSLVPVVGLDRSDAYRSAIRAVASDGRGGCVRLSVDEWPAGRADELIDLVTEIEVEFEDVDLVLDLGELVGLSVPQADDALRAALSAVPYPNDWRSLIVTGAGMPKAMPDGRGVHEIPRSDWQLYRQLAIHSPPARMPTFGDYAIAHPDPSLDVNPAWMNISATLRYTTKENWLVSKGELFKGSGGRGKGGAAVPPAAAALVARDEFTVDHCGAEDWIVAAANGGPTGNSERWRREGTRHHLEIVPNQLATLHAS